MFSLRQAYGKTLYIEQFPLFNEMKKWKKDIYGASYGIESEPETVNFLNLCLHDTTAITNVKRWCAA